MGAEKRQAGLEALFTSLDGGEALRQRILDLIEEVSPLAACSKIDLHIMIFAFTDAAIADALAGAARRYPTLTIRILADWNQRSFARGKQVALLANSGLPNLQIRYKKDQPYDWDAGTGQLHWSYRTSRGLLHHKTLGVLRDGVPWQLICGSFNWTHTAARSYENLLLMRSEQPGAFVLMTRVELEFEALWSDPTATFSSDEAEQHFQAITEAYRRDPAIAPEAIMGLTAGRTAPLQTPGSIADLGAGDAAQSADQRFAIAFSARRADDASSQSGYAEPNRTQNFYLRTPSFKTRRVPLSLTNLALDTIFRASPGETLKIAMYGLSSRVPEFAALLGAARRGVRLLILLDRSVGFEIAKRLADIQAREGLPLEVRMARRMMHQKYVVNPVSALVLTGTANMSRDAVSRHSEHRIRILGDAALARRYSEDFDMIWNRLAGKSDTEADDEEPRAGG